MKTCPVNQCVIFNQCEMQLLASFYCHQVGLLHCTENKLHYYYYTFKSSVTEILIIPNNPAETYEREPTGHWEVLSVPAEGK